VFVQDVKQLIWHAGVIALVVEFLGGIDCDLLEFGVDCLLVQALFEHVDQGEVSVCVWLLLLAIAHLAEVVEWCETKVVRFVDDVTAESEEVGFFDDHCAKVFVSM